MKIWIAISFTFVGYFSNGQIEPTGNLGIGFAIAIEPYLFEDSKNPPNVFKDPELKIKWNARTAEPFYNSPKYGIYHFICTEKTETYLKVLVNDSAVGYVPFNDTSYYFKSWEALLSGSTVNRLTVENPIRRGCSDLEEIVPFDCEKEKLHVSDMIEKGGSYWIQIYFSPMCFPNVCESDNVIYGWIKWKEENKLLVAIQNMDCYNK